MVSKGNRSAGGPIKVVSERLRSLHPAFTMAAYQHNPRMPAEAAHTFADMFEACADLPVSPR